MTPFPMQYSPMGGARSPAPIFDGSVAIPLMALFYSVIAHPVILSLTCGDDQNCLLEPQLENKLFWPILAIAAVIFVISNRSRLIVPSHIVCLFAYLGFAGLSITWAIRPEPSFIRFVQQAMVVTCVVLPALIAPRRADLMRGLFLCFAIAAVVNVIYVLNAPAEFSKELAPGYLGYFTSKNYLGEFGALAFLLSLYELTQNGFRRVLGLMIAILALVLLFMSNSKTSLALAFLAPMLSALTLVLRRTTRMNPAVVPWSIVSFFVLLSSVTSFTVYRLSYVIYGESTFTGRQSIWEFAGFEIGRRPVAGWGYQSFWLVGSDAPSVVEAPGWIGSMPNAHNGYLDTTLEMGYLGLVFLAIFLTATLIASARVLDRDPARGWHLVTLAFFIIIHNGLETTWMRAFEFMWVVFLFVAVEIARHWQPDALGLRANIAAPVLRRLPVRRRRSRGDGVEVA
jgi:exopolysaccharide production protein ExoQ